MTALTWCLLLGLGASAASSECVRRLSPANGPPLPRLIALHCAFCTLAGVLLTWRLL